MKNLYFCFLIFIIFGNLYAQENNSNLVKISYKEHYIDSLLPRVCIDLNLNRGGQMQNSEFANFSNAFSKAVDSKISTPRYGNAGTYGFDIESGVFLGHARHWGMGFGWLLFIQNSTLSINNYHIEYQSTDFQNNIFRQLITSDHPIKENIKTINNNIPIVMKYKHQLGKRLGVSGDVGMVINMSMHNDYNTNAMFDYEAIYKQTGNGKYIYDGSLIPSTVSDWLITKSQYNKTDPKNGAAYDFLQLSEQGFNVGLGSKPKYMSGKFAFKKGRIGLLIRPTLTYRIAKSIYVDFGFYYLAQLTGDNSSEYQLAANKIGSYNTLLKSEKEIIQSSYGINFGVRHYFYMKDRDGDGVRDRDDECPNVFGLKQYKGCPDFDGDGIVDKNDSCPKEFGLAKHNGCPDTDSDGVIDKYDRCPDEAGPAKLKGCPDRDGDGIPDIDDKCPDVPGLAIFWGCPDSDGDGIADQNDSCPKAAGPAKYYGCPDTDGDGVPDNLDSCKDKPGPLQNHGCPYPPLKYDGIRVPAFIDSDFITLVLFEPRKSKILEVSYPVIDKVIEAISKFADTRISIDGYTNKKGNREYNKTFSYERAAAVKDYMVNKGCNPSKIAVQGHGSAQHRPGNEDTAKVIKEQVFLQLKILRK